MKLQFVVFDSGSTDNAFSLPFYRHYQTILGSLKIDVKFKMINGWEIIRFKPRYFNCHNRKDRLDEIDFPNFDFCLHNSKKCFHINTTDVILKDYPITDQCNKLITVTEIISMPGYPKDKDEEHVF